MITQYRCAACQVSSTVELVGSEFSRERHGKLVADIRAEVELMFATCPACGARNPTGVAEQQRDERNIAILTVVMMVGLTVGAYFLPWLVLVVLGLFAALYLFAARKRVTWGLIANFATTVALGAVVWLAPRWAFLVLAVPTIRVLLHRRDPAERDERWKRAAEQLRFFDTAERRP